MAYGCSVGQGLTGLSTLSLSSFVAVAGILLGSAAGRAARPASRAAVDAGAGRGFSPVSHRGLTRSRTRDPRSPRPELNRRPQSRCGFRK